MATAASCRDPGREAAGRVMDVEIGPVLLRVPLRCHMRLVGRSPLSKLLRHGSFVAPPEGFIAALHREINDIALRDLNLLPVETLLIESGQRSLAVDIDMRNTQFIGADRTDGAFPDGYEPDVLALMDAFLEPKDCFFDVGANWGYMALHCLLRPDFAGRVIAFEPNERPRRDLEHLVAACGFEDRITILPYAIGDAHGAALLSRPAWSGTATVIDTTEGDPVALRTIDELGLPAARLIKVDIEGSEAAFVRGATHYITQHRPLIIFESRIDTPGGDWAGPYALLEALNYHCFAVEADVTASASWSRAIDIKLSPAGPGNRASFPVHLNVLAVPDRGTLETSAFRLNLSPTLSDANVQTRGESPVAVLDQCSSLHELLASIELPALDDRIDLAGVQPDLQGWGHEDPIFEYVMRHWAPRLILEVGSWKGASAIKMAELQKGHGIEGLIVCIDTWLGSNASLWHDPETRASLKLTNGFPTLFRQFAANVLHTGHGDRIRYLPMTSSCAAELLTAAGIEADADIYRCRS